MKKYKTKFPLDFSKSVVISFEVTTDEKECCFGVGYSGGDVLFKGQKSIDNFDENISIKDEKIEFSLYSKSVFAENIKAFQNGDNNLKSKYKKYINEKGEEIVEESEFFKNEEEIVFYDEEMSIPLDNSLKIYEKTEDFEGIKGLIVEDNTVYKQSEMYQITTYLYEGKEDDSDFIIKLEDKEDDLLLLSLDDTATRDLDNHSLSQTHQTIITTKENGETDYDINSSFSNKIIFNETPKRVRFVFSNFGRHLGVSLYNTEKKMYEKLYDFSFIKEVKEDFLKIYHNSFSSLSKVSTNF